MPRHPSPQYQFTVEQAPVGWLWRIREGGGNKIAGPAASSASARGSAQFVIGAMEALDRISRRRF